MARRLLVFLVWAGVAGALVMGMPGRATAAVIAVNSFADNSDADGFCTLREAITAANSDGGAEDCEAGGEFGADLIVFDANGPTTITLLSTLPDITDDEGLTIDGATLITISGDDASRVFNVSAGASLALESLTVRDGFTTGSGGGIANDGTLTVTNSTLTGNHADLGGGGIANSGALTITDSTLAGNSTTGMGGGILNNTGAVEVITSTLSGNSGVAGGAIDNHDGPFTITNSTLSGNAATGGGGIFNRGTLTITHATLAGNSAAAAGGGGIFSAFDGTLTITNSLVAKSPSGGDCANQAGGSFTADGNNLATDSSCNDLDPDFTTVTEAALNLGELADNGGPTETHALLTGSVAINAGDPLLCEASDQRGVLRDAQCDIGAFEFAAEIQGLIDRVALLVPSPNAAGLIAKLHAALASMADGRTRPACNQMRAFINQVNDLVEHGTIEAEVGEELIAAAQAIRAALGC